MGNPLSDYLSIVSRPQPEWNLLEIALEVSRIIEPSLDVDSQRAVVEQISDQVRGGISDQTGTYDLINQINRVLYEEWKFSGNAEDYYNHENSYLSRVLDTRKGIPITLSILYQEVAARNGLKLLPVAMPRHFLLKCRMPLREIFIDAFNGGEILLEEECRQRLEAVAEEVQFSREFLKAAAPDDVVLRMLMNLKIIYRRDGSARLLMEVLERRIPLMPDPLAEILERGFTYLSLENFACAVADLELFVKETKDGRMKEMVEKRLAPIRELATGRIM